MIHEECGCTVDATQCFPAKQLISFCPLHASAQKMYKALQEIAEDKGVEIETTSPLKYAWGYIESMLSIAREALLVEEQKRCQD